MAQMPIRGTPCLCGHRVEDHDVRKTLNLGTVYGGCLIADCPCASFKELGARSARADTRARSIGAPSPDSPSAGSAPAIVSDSLTEMANELLAGKEDPEQLDTSRLVSWDIETPPQPSRLSKKVAKQSLEELYMAKAAAGQQTQGRDRLRDDDRREWGERTKAILKDPLLDPDAKIRLLQEVASEIGKRGRIKLAGNLRQVIENLRIGTTTMTEKGVPPFVTSVESPFWTESEASGTSTPRPSARPAKNTMSTTDVFPQDGVDPFLRALDETPTPGTTRTARDTMKVRILQAAIRKVLDSPANMGAEDIGTLIKALEDTEDSSTEDSENTPS